VSLLLLLPRSSNNAESWAEQPLGLLLWDQRRQPTPQLALLLPLESLDQAAAAEQQVQAAAGEQQRAGSTVPESSSQQAHALTVRGV